MLADALGVRKGWVRTLIAELEKGHLPQRADALACKLGFRNRHHLAHRLSRSGLPALVHLRAMVKVVIWVHRWETEGLA